MEDFLEKLKENKTYTLGFFILLIIIMISFLFIYFYLRYEFKDEDVTIPNEEIIITDDLTKVVVEIKGEVVTPGVYEVNSNKRVNDVIKLAGGLTSKANTKTNNLSKKVEDEMLIIIYSNEEIKNYLETLEKEKELIDKCNEDSLSSPNSCITSNTLANNSKISLNNATIEELMTLPGIKEAKASAIINYRNEHKFNSIEELKEVSGIGDALYDQVKDLIIP